MARVATSLTHADVASWLSRYIEAWHRYDREAIGQLFSADAAYHYSPFEEPIRTRERIIEWWLENPDAAGTFEAGYQPIAVDGDLAVANGRTRYFETPGGLLRQEFDNLFTMRFNDAGECTEFRDWYVARMRE